MCQWAKHLGATVIGTVGSKDKAEVAREYGCDHPIVYGEEDFAERVHAITGGGGGPVVYDSVGQENFERALQCLRRPGALVSFCEASGGPAPMPPPRPGPLRPVYFPHPS